MNSVNVGRRLGRIRLDGGGELARRQRSKTSLLELPEPTLRAKSDDTTETPEDLLSERDSLRTALVEAGERLMALQNERDALEKQVQLLVRGAEKVASKTIDLFVFVIFNGGFFFVYFYFLLLF